MTRTPIDVVNSLLERLEATATKARVWPLAITGAEDMLAGGFPTNTLGSPGQVSGIHADRTATAAIAGERDDAARIYGELLRSQEQLESAAARFDMAVDAAVAAGYTTEPGTRCAKCGRTPTRVIDDKHPLVNGVCLHCRCIRCDAIPTNEGMDRLVNGVCIEHRCIDCGTEPSGKGNDRLRRRRCRRCYGRLLKTNTRDVGTDT